MIYGIIGLSLLFFSIGFILTENNAKYLLSGYNTMSEEDRKKVDIKAYIPFVRTFHMFLGISYAAIGTFLIYFVSENAGGIFLTVYPIVAYIYFISASSKYSKGLSDKWNKTAVVTLIGTLLFVVALLGYGVKENKIIFDSESISFKGSYGETLTEAEIRSIELVNQFPKISIKTNGFSLGTIKKGYFKTKHGEIVKLILNSDNKPAILFTKVDGKKIYYSAKKKPNEEVLKEIKKSFPNVVYK